MKKTLIGIALASMGLISMASPAATTITTDNTALSQYETVDVHGNIAAYNSTSGGMQSTTIAGENLTIGSTPSMSLTDVFNKVLQVTNSELQDLDQYSHAYRNMPMDMNKPGTLTFVFHPKASSSLPVKTCVIEFSDANIKQVRTINVPGDAQFCH